MAKQLKRGVKCLLCGREMYYANNSKHEPELRLEITDQENSTELDSQWVHLKCWNMLILPKNKVKAFYDLLCHIFTLRGWKQWKHCMDQWSNPENKYRIFPIGMVIESEIKEPFKFKTKE